MQHRTRKKRASLQDDYADIIGDSPQLFEVLKQIDMFANLPVTVMICGETGTGKELVAAALHENSQRARAAKVVVNCAAIPTELMESEMFGYDKGAFTGAEKEHPGKFERAHRGTLFLDEIGELSLLLQPKLLRAIETGDIEHLGGTRQIHVDVRVVVATNRNLEDAVRAGTFRPDLYHRLEGFSIYLPPLRERDGDIPLLAEYFLQKESQRLKKKVTDIAPQTFTLLESYPWPGNVRELRKVLLYAIAYTDGDAILPEHLPPKIHASDTQGVSSLVDIRTPPVQQIGQLPQGLTLAELEKQYILQTLTEQNGNMSKTAAALGIHPRTLRRKLQAEGQ